MSDLFFFFLMLRRPPRATQSRSSAASDVYKRQFEEEPLPAESPLWDMEDALISPHVAGFTPRYDERAAALFAGNLARYLEGEPLLNALDKKQGY